MVASGFLASSEVCRWLDGVELAWTMLDFDSFNALATFGLLELRSDEKSATESVERPLYRKAPLFDRFVKFSVQVEGSATRD
jgi:hypothetical protein